MATFAWQKAESTNAAVDYAVGVDEGGAWGGRCAWGGRAWSDRYARGGDHA